MNKHLYLFVLVFFFLFKCQDNSWTTDRRADILNNCKLEAKGHIEDETELESICLCSLNKFISNFSFDEYLEMKKLDVLSDKSMYGRVESLISEILKDCRISL